MSQPRYDVVGVGNAIVDVIAATPETFLTRHGITKGAMTLIEEERAEELTAALPDAVVAAGGSAANTVAGVVSFGGTAAYIGKVADDALGKSYGQDFANSGVPFRTKALKAPPTTARSLIAVTPDGQRSMSTFLGASSLLAPSDIDKELVEASSVTFLEGYLFDRDDAKAAFVQAAEYAKAAGRSVSLTLSDTFCVERHRPSFRHLVKGHIDVLFANEYEIMSLYEVDDLEVALRMAEAECAIVAVTRSADGSVVAAEGERVLVKAEPVAKVIDTTGAGDQYAAGFLFGLARGLSWAMCGQLGSIAAAEVISHMGPRPEVSLKALANGAV